ncbi:MAG: response regulator transcription factor [Acidobacteria bacterium]|jgi:DNA-binding response OmpR family regulator|nr:response regulator transcription factor [Acidobacteriota bacterium]
MTSEISDSSNGKSVFVVEDDVIISRLLQHLFERRGYDVQIAGDGQAALKLIEVGETPALVVLDVMLPFMDGFELIDRIRRKPTWADVPIIMLTSKSQEHNIVRALDAGATDYVIKPFQPEELMARVRRFIK